MGADALGFHIFRHQDAVAKTEKFAEIFSYLPAAVNKVLLTDVDYGVLLGTILPRLRVDTIQLYPDWLPEQIEALLEAAPRPIRVLKVMSAQTSENSGQGDAAFLRSYEPVVDGFLLDSWRIGGTGRTADWDHCAEIVRMTRLPVFLAGGLTRENVAEALKQVRPFGVDVENGVSDRILNGPLVKNMQKCRDFIDAVRACDSAGLRDADQEAVSRNAAG